MVHLVEGSLLLTLQYELRFSTYKKSILWRNLEFDVKKRCSATRWTTLYRVEQEEMCQFELESIDLLKG